MKEIKTTKKQLKQLVNEGVAIDISTWETDDLLNLNRTETLKSIAYSENSFNEWNGNLYYSLKTGKLYAIIGRGGALFVLGF